MDISKLSNKEKWLLAIIEAVPYVHGDTRLQKYTLLVGKQILEDQEFFNDWRPDNFGGYSPSVTICVEQLRKKGFIDSQEFTYDKDKKVNRYTLSQKGKSAIHEFLKTQSEIFTRVKEIIGFYHSKRLIDLLNNVYVLYPGLTDKSKIKAEVNKSITNNNSYLSPEYEIAIDDREFYTPTISPSTSEHVYSDDYFRQKLAKSIGLDTVPKLDPKAFERLTGIISSKIKTKDFDSVELVKAVRGC